MTATPTDALKALIRSSIALGWNKGDWSVLEPNYAPDMVVHTPGEEPLRSRDEFKSLFAMVHTAFPDWTLTIEEILGEGNRVVALFTVEGKHEGPYLGFPPTGKRVSVREINFYEFKDGKLQELWPAPDIVGILGQIGVGPPPLALIAASDLLQRAGRLFARRRSTARPAGEPGGAPAAREDATTSPEAARNKATARLGIEQVWNGKDWAAAERAYADDVVVRSTHLAEPLRGLPAFSRFHTALHNAYSDLHLSIGDAIAEGDLVGARWTLTGVHTGDLFGIPPTGRRVSFLELALFRFVDGKAAEIWWLPDRTAQMSQLGLMLAGPLPAPLSAFIGFTQRIGSLFRRD